MPYESKWVPPELFIEHKGVKVYHAYEDQDYEWKLTYHYAVGSEDDMLSEELIEFDVRDLPTYECKQISVKRPDGSLRAGFKSDPEQAIQQTIDQCGVAGLIGEDE